MALSVVRIVIVTQIIFWSEGGAVMIVVTALMQHFGSLSRPGEIIRDDPPYQSIRLVLRLLSSGL
jgi:hypothetical protein